MLHLPLHSLLPLCMKYPILQPTQQDSCQKHSYNKPGCQELGMGRSVFSLLAVDTYSNWGKEDQNAFSWLASLLAISQYQRTMNS